MRKIIAAILIIAGVLTIHITVIGEYYTRHRRNEALKLIQAAAALTPATADPSVTPDPNAGQQEEVTYDNSWVEAYGQTLLGVIAIQKIDLTMPIVEGVEDSNLIYGVGHMPGTDMPGEWGNVVLAGHRNYVFGQSFNRLNEVELNDDIMIIYNGQTYTYRVYDIFVVLPEDVWVRNSSSSDKIITLITCTPILTATHRLIVRARLL